jgi:hypothetical protein
METIISSTSICVPWNKRKLVGQKAPFKLKEIWGDPHSPTNGKSMSRARAVQLGSGQQASSLRFGSIASPGRLSRSKYGIAGADPAAKNPAACAVWDAPESGPEVLALRAAIDGGDAIVTTGLVLQELLQGFAGPRARKDVVQRFAALPAARLESRALARSGGPETSTPLLREAGQIEHCLESMLPVAAHMLPVRACLIPSIGNPVSSPVLEDEAPGNPRIRMAAPFPVARSPDIAVARRRSPLFACRRGRHVGLAAGSRGCRRSAYCAGA